MATTASDPQRRAHPSSVVRAQLFVALSCGASLDPPSRHAIDGIDEIHLGRERVRRAHRHDEGGRRRLGLSFLDTHISAAHARIVRRDDGWSFEDLGSKNGSLVNGAAARSTELADGDCLQIGQTLLVFRAAMATPEDAPSDVEGSGRSPAFATLVPALARDLDALATVATRQIPILLVSETGTGKELLAHAIHALSRREGAFLPLNCGGLPATLFESVLFGHRRGAFSGALHDHPGVFRAADRGTLLLDEVGDMPLAVQSALLRTLQDGEVLPVGATHPAHVDVRVVSATHKNLEGSVAEGTFREDLFARMSGFTFRLPPLRERREDIGLLATHLLRRVVGEHNQIPALSAAAGLQLFRHSWPRNVRELEKCLAHAAALAGAGPIEVEHLPESLRWVRPSSPPPSGEGLRSRLVGLLTESAGNVSFVAIAMRTSRSQVHRWMKRFAIDPGHFRR